MDYSITNNERDTRIHENEPVKPQETALKALIVAPCHLINGISPEQAGCRHLIKEAYAVCSDYDRVVIEHEDDMGQTVRRIIKDFGNSVEPFYEDLQGNRFEFEHTPEGLIRRL